MKDSDGTLKQETSLLLNKLGFVNAAALKTRSLNYLKKLKMPSRSRSWSMSPGLTFRRHRQMGC